MALTDKSLITYGLQVTTSNSSLDFKSAIGGPTRLATLSLGFYSITSLWDEVIRAMQAVDPTALYSYSIDRSLNNGRENRGTLSTNGSYLSLLFSSGPRNASSVAPLLGFASIDKTGSTSYQGLYSMGTTLSPDYIGYNYVDPIANQLIQGAKLVSTSGRKEAIVYQIMKFLEVEFRYEKKINLINWQSFFNWAIQQRPFEIKPEISDYNNYFDVTLERTGKDQNGMGFTMAEMLPQFPNYYQTGKLTMRVNVVGGEFILL